MTSLGISEFGRWASSYLGEAMTARVLATSLLALVGGLTLAQVMVRRDAVWVLLLGFVVVEALCAGLWYATGGP